MNLCSSAKPLFYQPHSFMEIDHEVFSLLLMIQERQSSVTGKHMGT